MFTGRKLIIATKHHKEQVIAPLVENALGVTCFINDNLDTDLLGTFTGEVERESDPIATVRKKCLKAMELSNCDLGVASEGSFGPHPSSFFAVADDEFLIFIDQKNNLEIIVRELSMETNFNGQEVTTEKELLDFAAAVAFPSHGLILRASKTDHLNTTKGITDLNILKDTFDQLINGFNTAYVETDMRALYNPSRMKVIKAAAEKLVLKIQSLCPNCDQPGFGITEVKTGLECNLCGAPTNSILSHIYECERCKFQKETVYPHQKTSEDPMYCDYCNP